MTLDELIAAEVKDCLHCNGTRRVRRPLYPLPGNTSTYEDLDCDACADREAVVRRTWEAALHEAEQIVDRFQVAMQPDVLNCDEESADYMSGSFNVLNQIKDRLRAALTAREEEEG